MTCTSTIMVGDCLDVMRAMAPKSVQLTFCSSPYDDCRTYGIDFNLKGQAFVDWCFVRFMECLRVTDGLVAWVLEGKTKKFRYSATPLLLMADLHRAGVHLRKPPLYVRDGIPGSGGPDWLKNKYEFIVCATNGGKLPWSDNTAMGHPPIFGPGGAPSHRTTNGTRVGPSQEQRARFGSHRVRRRMQLDGTLPGYKPPELANPGNLIDCGAGGGGNIGSALAHENEAPFPEYLAEFFIRSFCPPGGTVLDCFSGSGTTAAVALKNGRNAIGIDIRESQVELSKRRVAEVAPLFVGGAA
jgi:hypothetical protein